MSKTKGKYPGRPTLRDGEKRETIFRFVTTKAEAAKIRRAAKAQGRTISEYLRQVAIPSE